MNMETLETRLAAAKAAGDSALVRELLPAVNAARRAAREAEATRVNDLCSRGLRADGTPMTPDEKLLAAIGL